MSNAAQELRELRERTEEFIEEYQGLAEDPRTGSAALGRIISLGAEVGTPLSDALSEFSEATVSASRSLREGFANPDLSPRELDDRQSAYEIRKVHYEAAHETFVRFTEFMDAVMERYAGTHAPGQGQGSTPVGVGVREDAPSNSYRPSLWRRLFTS